MIQSKPDHNVHAEGHMLLPLVPPIRGIQIFLRPLELHPFGRACAISLHSS